MFDYLKGDIIEITPTYLILEANQIGFFINISLQTYGQLTEKKQTKIYIHQIIREDAHLLYGFYTKEEREVFRKLITVSGVGATTAQLMLSSLTVDEIKTAIISSNVNLLKSVKGIGLKTAQRIIVDLKDSFSKASEADMVVKGSLNLEEAIMALVALGFNKNISEKTVRKIYKENPNLTLEQIIKSSLKLLTK